MLCRVFHNSIVVPCLAHTLTCAGMSSEPSSAWRYCGPSGAMRSSESCNHHTTNVLWYSHWQCSMCQTIWQLGGRVTVLSYAFFGQQRRQSRHSEWQKHREIACASVKLTFKSRGTSELAFSLMVREALVCITAKPINIVSGRKGM